MNIARAFIVLDAVRQSLERQPAADLASRHVRNDNPVHGPDYLDVLLALRTICEAQKTCNLLHVDLAPAGWVKLDPEMAKHWADFMASQK